MLSFGHEAMSAISQRKGPNVQIKNLRDFFKFNAEKIAKNSVFESPHLFFDVYGILPGQSQKIHTHLNSDKIYLVLEGEAVVTVGDTHRTILNGQAVFASAGEPHGIQNNGQSPAAVLVVMAPKP